MFIKMLKAALKDGVLTEDELKMLKEVDKFYGHYNREFKVAVSDGFITPDECKKLRDLRDSLYENAYMEAIKDGVVTTDERAILNEIQKATELSDDEIKEIEKKVKGGARIKLESGDCE